MIRVKKLKELLNKLPANAICWVYEGDDTGIGITQEDKDWWIRISESKEEDNYTEGFE